MEIFDQDIERCLEVLHQGGLILYPTDTIWGIGCDATNAKAVARIYELKHRPDSKAMIILVADEKTVLEYTAAPDLAVFDYLKTVKKPTTVIYEGAIGLAENLIAEDGSIAIRICQDPFCKALIKRFRKPVVSTSANRSGDASPRNFSMISEEIKNGVDYIVKYRQNDMSEAEPSSVIRWKNGNIEILRS
ncbi:MAG: L-threonylcarbamoyladenylate synthase [Chitinophagaceae bacterium]|nr:L-threonylcarbamoyladenylate synthase [Chitinophagaceae bacterium]